MASLYDPINYDLKNFQWEFILCPDLWERFNTNGITVDYTKWDHVKMMDDTGNLSDETRSIPTSCGGIYVYVVIPPVIEGVGAYIMYVGKATKTRSENLRARVRSYKSNFDDPITRPKLYRLFKQVGKYVYVYYLPMDSTAKDITEMEDRLIATYGLPPCNVDIQIQTVKAAVKAFR